MRETTTVAQRTPLSRERVVEAALELVDAEGADALTMRRLGRALGVEAMSIYEYTRGKDELVRALMERLLEELELPTSGHPDWKQRIRDVIGAWLQLAERHPKAFPLLYRERPFFPRDLFFPEEIYDALRQAGFDEPATVSAYGALALFVNGALMRGSPATSGTSSRWDDAPPFDDDEFPRIAELLPHAHSLAWRTLFDRGLELLLSGLEAELAAAKDVRAEG
jgi:TetR/AcrR family transcriptional regulator, tetracycline repressor protein